MKNVIESIEEDQKHNNTRKMYQIVNQLKTGYQHKFSIIRNKKGELAMNTKEKTEIWKEYFDKLLNTEEPRELIHHHKHQGLDPLIRSVSRVSATRTNASSVFQLFSFLVVCSGMISKGFGFVAFFASVKASSVCIHLSCLVCL